MKQIILLNLVVVLVFTNLKAQQKSLVQRPDSKIGGGVHYKLNQQESGLGIRYQLVVGNQTEVVFNYAHGYFFKTNEEYKVTGTSDLDVDAHYKVLKPQHFNLYALGGFNVNTRKWVGLYNHSDIENVDLKGGINAGVGIEYAFKSFLVYAECKAVLFDQGTLATAGVLYHFLKKPKQKKGRTVRSRSLR
jgi:hypothetical protein